MLASSSRIPHLGQLLPPQEVREGFPKRLVGCRDVSVPKITGAHRSGRPREGGVTLLRQLRSWKADLRQHPRVSQGWKRRLAASFTWRHLPRSTQAAASDGPPAAARRAGPAADPDKAWSLRLSHQTHAGFLPGDKPSLSAGCRAAPGLRSPRVALLQALARGHWCRFSFQLLKCQPSWVRRIENRNIRRRSDRL